MVVYYLKLLIVGHFRLVVATIEVHSHGILKFEGIQTQQDLHRPRPSINKVAVEQDWVLRVWLSGHLLNHVNKVKVLPMQVSHNCDPQFLKYAQTVQYPKNTLKKVQYSCQLQPEHVYQMQYN